MDLLVFVSGFLIGMGVTGIVGGLYLRRKIQRMSPANMMNDMMGDMMDNMSEALEEVEDGQEK